MNAFVVIVIIKHRAEVGHHECIRGKNRGRNRRGSVDGKEGANSRELAADFFFLDVEKASNVLDHLFVGESHLIAGGAVWRRRGNDVGGVACTVHGRGRARGNEDGGRGAGHRWTVMWNVEGKGVSQVVDAKRTIGWKSWSEGIQCIVGMRIV